MDGWSRWISGALAALGLLVLPGCVTGPAPPPDPTPVSKSVLRTAAQRLTAVVVSSQDDINPWIGRKFSRDRGPEDADGGSGVPITADGYILTADHVLANAGQRNVFVIHGENGRLRAHRARIVWRSPNGDLALVHATIATPNHYEWTPPQAWMPSGTPIMHAGIATGFKSPPGRLISSIPPESTFSGNRLFKHDIPLEPGDSGGPVIDARGRLVGVNSAVEFLVPLETAFFIESEANRPNVAKLNSIIERDRRRHGG